MSTVEADFDRLALLDTQGWNPNNHYHNSLLQHIPTDCEQALEIGCGTGALARQLATRSRTVIALDLSSAMIRVARSRSSRFHNLEFLKADVTKWNFPQSHFDFICSIATLHHLEQRDLLVKIKAALKPGGVLVAIDLVESNSFGERLVDTLALAASGSLRLIHNGRLKPPAEVRRAWEQHGQHDSYLTMAQVRALADELLPGSKVTRLLLWRYQLVYQKQPAEVGSIMP
jgi:SAM-dependent methyltransferase